MILQFIEKLIDKIYAILPRTRPESKHLDEIKIIAHRGAHDNPKGIIENTLQAFDRAKKLGCWGIEFDIHVTKDKKIIVNHDSDLNRLWNIDKKIRELTFAELRELAPQVPLLGEVINRFAHNMHLFIEIKAPFDAEKELYDSLQELTPAKDYHLISLDEDIFSGLKRFPRGAMFLVAVHNNNKKFCQLSVDKSYAGVLGNYFLFHNMVLKRLKKNNKKIGVGFVDSRFSLYREVKRGIPWLFTNHAERVCPVLNEIQKQ